MSKFTEQRKQYIEIFKNKIPVAAVQESTLEIEHICYFINIIAY